MKSLKIFFTTVVFLFTACDNLLGYILTDYSWQKEYAELLRSYAEIPHNSDLLEAEWYFTLHDIDHNGIPELLLATICSSGHIKHRYIYTFEDGDIKQFEFTPLTGTIWLPICNSPWIVLSSPAGSGNSYYKLKIDGNAVVTDIRGNYFLSDEGHNRYYEGSTVPDNPEWYVFSLDGKFVDISEFENIFGKWESRAYKEWLELVEINEANIEMFILKS